MLSQKTGNPWTAERTTERVGCSALVIARSTIDPAAPTGRKVIAQGRAKRRPGYMAHWYRFRLMIRPDFRFGWGGWRLANSDLTATNEKPGDCPQVFSLQVGQLFVCNTKQSFFEELHRNESIVVRWQCVEDALGCKDYHFSSGPTNRDI